MRHSPEEGFAQLEKLGTIREVSIFDRGQIVAELHREFRVEGRDTLVIAGTHAEISQLTDAIRQDQKDGGELGISQSFDRFVSLQVAEYFSASSNASRTAVPCAATSLSSPPTMAMTETDFGAENVMS